MELRIHYGWNNPMVEWVDVRLTFQLLNAIL